MTASFPPLPPDLVELASGGVSLLVGTCSADLVPDCVRAMGVRVWPGACALTVIIPARTGATSLANLRATRNIALTMSHVPTHRTVQIKGTVTDVRDGDEADRDLATRYRIMFSETLAWVGQPAGNTLRLGIWPCAAVDVQIAVVYAQTPGPVAGARMPLPPGGA